MKHLLKFNSINNIVILWHLLMIIIIFYNQKGKPYDACGIGIGASNYGASLA